MREARGWLPEAQKGKCFTKEGRSAPCKLLRSEMGTAKGPLGLVIGMARVAAVEERGSQLERAGVKTQTKGR